MKARLGRTQSPQARARASGAAWPERRGLGMAGRCGRDWEARLGVAWAWLERGLSVPGGLHS